MAMNEPNESFFKLQSFLFEATKQIQTVFHRTWHNIFKEIWTDNNIAGKSFQEKCPEIFKNALNLQKELLKLGDSNKWDISLYNHIFNNAPFNSNKLINFVREINYVRNQVNHSNMRLDSKESKRLWTKIRSNMLSLGCSKIDLDTICKRIQNKDLTNRNAVEKNEQVDLVKKSANTKFNAGDYIGSIELYTKAILIENVEDQDLAILYSNRSLAYLKLHETSQFENDRNLSRALNDAHQTVKLNPTWHKGYARLGSIYKEFNELSLSKENFSNALVLSPDSEDYKNSLANVSSILAAQERHEHLSQQQMPRSTNERNDEFIEAMKKRLGSQASNLDLEEITKLFYKMDPVLQDVFKAHEYRDGLNKEGPDYIMAAKYYAKAMMKGNAEGYYNMALLAMDGKGMKQDYKLGMSYLKQAADQPATRKLGNFDIPNVGKAEAEHSLGLAYHNGIYVEKDIQKAVEWYEKGAEHGCPNSSNNLGVMFLHAEGVPQDIARAETLFLTAYKLGDLNAMGNLVNLYLAWNKYDKALLWHERALEKNCLLSVGRNDEIRAALDKLKSIRDKSSSFKNQGPFFLPNQDMNLGLQCFMDYLEEIIHAVTEEFQEKDRRLIIGKSPLRTKILKEHREVTLSIKKRLEDGFNISKTTVKPPKKQRNSKDIAGFKQITFSEIDFTEDHVLNGHILSVTSIARPCTGFSSVHFVIEDKNNHIELLSIYNLGTDYAKIERDFEPGVKFDIVNPYVRLSADFKARIRVDDTKSIRFKGKIEKMCRWCGTGQSKFHCGKCNKAYYCSKECQIYDWQSVSHKSICY